MVSGVEPYCNFIDPSTKLVLSDVEGLRVTIDYTKSENKGVKYGLQ